MEKREVGEGESVTREDGGETGESTEGTEAEY